MKLIRSFLVFRKISALLALSLCLVTFNTALGQSALGSIYGDVKSGSKVTVINEDTGLTREASSDLNGRFNVGSLPPGNYTVSATKPDGSPSKQVVRVNPGIGTVLSLSEPISLEEVIVSGRLSTQIDTTTSQVSTTYSAEQLAILPVAQDITNVALLAPGTVKGDSEFGNLASFGGSSVAENSYYINGFNVTNLFKNLAYSSVPFYAIESEQVLTGGYGPEYGLSTGGVVNLVTKKGTNSWKSGLAVNLEPKAFRGHSPTTYTSAGEPYRKYHDNSFSSTTYDAWIGGPLIKDKLFVYAIGQLEKQSLISFPNSYYGGGVIDRTTRMPYGLINLDWNLNANHTLSLTAFNDSTKQETARFAEDYDADGWAIRDTFSGTDHNNTGGNTIIGKYSGSLTDNLSLSVQYGQLNNKRENYQLAANGDIISYNGVIHSGNIQDSVQPGCPYVIYHPTNYTDPLGVGKPSCYIDEEINAQNNRDQRKSGRIDIDYRWSNTNLGDHLFKFGVESDDWSSIDGTSKSGGLMYYYRRYSQVNPTPAAPIQAVQIYQFQTGADVGVKSNAFYLKDDWRLTDKLLVQLGLRSDSFRNLNGDGIAYLKQNNILQPRFGFALDMAGDSTSKLYGSYGVYSLPVAATVAVRAASASMYRRQTWTYSAIDPITGRPTLIEPVNGDNDDTMSGEVKYLNQEKAVAPNPSSVASKNLDPTIQNEFILGYQRHINKDWTLGARFTYRDLKKTTDDMCDWRPFGAWASANGYTFKDKNLPGCFILNPGSALNVDADVDGDGTLENINLSAADVGLPKAVRRYVGIELTVEKALSNNWSTQLSYTYAHNYGNAEGLVKSDIGQSDTGVTQDFDDPELMVGASGNLPNDRRHTFKGTGLYKLNEEVTLSFGTLLQSGRPKICLGIDDEDYIGYGVAYFRCGGNVVPRGSIGNTPWLWNVDLGVTYEPTHLPNLSLQAKVFNLLNKNTVTNLDSDGEDDAGDPLTSFGTPKSYQTPRYVQLSAVYKFGAKK